MIELCAGIAVGFFLGALLFWNPWLKIENRHLRKAVAGYRENTQWWADYAGLLARRVAELEDTAAADWWKAEEGEDS